STASRSRPAPSSRSTSPWSSAGHDPARSTPGAAYHGALCSVLGVVLRRLVGAHFGVVLVRDVLHLVDRGIVLLDVDVLLRLAGRLLARLRRLLVEARDAGFHT